MCNDGVSRGVPGILYHTGGLLENQSIFVDVGYMSDTCAGREGQLELVCDSDGDDVLQSLFPV